MPALIDNLKNTTDSLIDSISSFHYQKNRTRSFKQSACPPSGLPLSSIKQPEGGGNGG
jgi:hypothetical protein